MDVLTFSLVILYSMLLNTCYCLNLKLFNVTKIQNEGQWQQAVATWYGAPDGAGTDGGACGYGGSVENPPLSKMISAGGPSIYHDGEGCGACYEVKCTGNALCSGKPVTVTISDQCPGCESSQFDLSGSAMGSMAIQGKADNLRNVGRLNVQYKRVACQFGTSIVFTVDNGANPYYFATEIEYEDGDGDLVDVELKQDHESKETWFQMQRSWGARWALQANSGLKGPFSIKLTQAEEDGTKKTIVADSVIPVDWKPGQVYRSAINFK